MDNITEPSARSTLVLVDLSRPRLATPAPPKRGSAPRRECTSQDGSARSLVTGLTATGLRCSFLRPGQLDFTPKNDNAAVPADSRPAASGFLTGEAELGGAVIVELAGRRVFRPAISRTDVLVSSGDAA